MKQNYNVQNMQNNFIQSKTKHKRDRIEMQSTAASPSDGHKLSISSASSLDSGVFTICNPSKLEFLGAFKYPSPDTISYTRHSYLDVKPLTLKERCHLARIHYVNIANGARLIVIVISLALLCYIASTTLNSLSEPVVHLDYKLPNRSLPPAITICTHCVLCSFPKSSINQIGAKQFLFKNIDQLNPNEGSAKKDIRIDCWLEPYGLKAGMPRFECDQLANPVTSAQESRKCTTFFSDIKGQTTRALKKYPQLELKFDWTPKIVLEITGNYIRTSTISTGFENIRNAVNGKGTATDQNVNTTGLYITIHDNTILPYMYNMAVHQLMPGKQTLIPFRKTIQTLLPPPFTTKCKYYNLKGNTQSSSQAGEFITRGHCILHCMWDIINQNKPCSNFYSIFTASMIEEKENEERAKRLRSMIKQNQNLVSSSVDFDMNGFFKICPRSNQSFQEYLAAKEQCLETCPIACKVETFEDNRMEDTKLTDPKLKATSKIVLLWDIEPVVEIEHRPKWSLADLLGTIGGLLHIWGSVSVIHIIWFIIKFFQTSEIFPEIVCNPIVTII